MLERLLYIALGGAGGALARYAVSGLAYRLLGSGFPWGTLAVNGLGSFVIGILWAASERAPLSPEVSALVFVGFLGAFTTFSTYALETVNLLRDGETLSAIANLIVSNGLAIGLAILGLVLGRSLFG